MRTLKDGELVQSPVSGTTYRIAKVLGEGGFGRAYRAQELGRRGQPVDDVCIKTTLDQSSWHRESYFGELLRNTKRAIQTLDSFVLAPKGGRGELHYCLVLELADRGTVLDYLEQTGKPYTPARARREIVALLKVLDQLHGAAATHRDITPMNIFVCGNGSLKLGDFGIARHDLANKKQTIDAFNPGFVTKGFLQNDHRYWIAADDVYQMGQLLGVLLTGRTQVDEPITAKEITALACDEALKAVVKRAIGPRGKRFADAYEMLQALAGDELSEGSALSSLAGRTVVFTGPLSIKRFDAEVLVLQAGGKVAKRVGKDVDVVVQGSRSPHYKGGGHKGSKLQEAEKLIKHGQRIAIIGETELRRLTRGA